MDRTLIEASEAFLKETFAASPYLQAHPEQKAYRLEHSYRVANIAGAIARQEGLDETKAVIAGLLHDIAYCREMADKAAWLDHGRHSAAIVRPFLEQLGFTPEDVNDICYGIAIHVDDQADFQWPRTAFAETVGDADNIDRFDAYRIYEILQTEHFSEKPLAEKKAYVEQTLGKLQKWMELRLGTPTAETMWQQRLRDYIFFYEKLQAQLESSSEIL